MPEFVGVTAMEVRVAAVTVKVVLPAILPKAAVIVAFPAAAPAARPLLSTVAADVLDELQVTCAVISWVVPPEYVPNAVNCWVFPAGTLGLAGETAMEVRVAAVTVKVVLPAMLPKVAVIVAFPAELPVARPLLLTVATGVLEELQMTCVVIFWGAPAEYVPKAVNCWVVPAGAM